MTQKIGGLVCHLEVPLRVHEEMHESSLSSSMSLNGGYDDLNYKSGIRVNPQTVSGVIQTTGSSGSISKKTKF